MSSLIFVTDPGDAIQYFKLDILLGVRVDCEKSDAIKCSNNLFIFNRTSSSQFCILKVGTLTPNIVLLNINTQKYISR